MTEFQTRAQGLVQDRALGYDQKLRRLAALATEALPYPELSEACHEALDKRVICDLFEGNAPVHRPLHPSRLREGHPPGPAAPRAAAADRSRRRPRLPADHVRPRAERDHLPGVPRRPRQGARPVRRRHGSPTTNSTASCAASGSASTACCPTRSCTSTSARTTAASPARSSASSARCASRCRTSPQGRPDDRRPTTSSRMPCAPCSRPASRTSSTTR